MATAKKTTTKKAPAKKTTTRAPTRKTTELKPTSKDAEDNKGLAIVAYLGILFIIPLLTGDYKKSPFLKFHTNQGAVLFLAAVCGYIAVGILMGILTALLLRFFWGLSIIIGLFMPLVSIVFLVLLIIGIINVLNGRMKPLPLIGKFTLIK